ncbi:MAG: hypothetical protein ACLSVD_06765 [Eggerthellaceae bacterium]
MACRYRHHVHLRRPHAEHRHAQRALHPGQFAAGERASELGHPIVLDPVGAAAGSAHAHGFRPAGQAGHVVRETCRRRRRRRRRGGHAAGRAPAMWSMRTTCGRRGVRARLRREDGRCRSRHGRHRHRGRR